MDPRKHSFIHRIILLLIFIMLFVPFRKALAFQVEPLPGNNLIQNPWFRRASNPTRAGFDSWTNVNNHWTLSQKITNPSPDSFISGACSTSTPTYCGTTAKLAADDGNAIVGVDAYLFQVVSAEPTHKKLKFFVHWVAHYVDPFEVKIYGANQVNGPWNHIWTPLYQVEVSFPQPPPGFDVSWLWTEMTSRTPPVETIQANGYPYYKVEIRANIPSPEGFKLTGVYFATENTGDVVPTATPGFTSSPTATGTSTPAPTQTPSPTSISALDLIYEDNFEIGNFSTWSGNSTDNGDLTVSLSAALIGNFGMQAVIDDTNAIYVTDDAPAAEQRYRMRFYFDPNSITIADKNAHFIFYAYSGTSKVVLRVEFRNYRGSYQLRFSLSNDSSTWISSNYYTIIDTPHLIEVDWKAATAVGANNGNLTLWIDEVQQGSLSGVDNDTHRIDRVRLGAVAGIDSGTSGIQYFDAFESRRSTYIGPMAE